MRSYAEMMSTLEGGTDAMQVRLSIWCNWLDQLANTRRGPWWDQVEDPVECEEIVIEHELFDIARVESILRSARLAAGATGIEYTEGRVLDPCCGDGRWIAALAAVCEDKSWLERTWLIDPDPRQLALARMRITASAEVNSLEAFYEGLAERAICIDALDVGTGVQRELFDARPDEDEQPVILPRGFDMVVSVPRDIPLDHERREVLRERLVAARSQFPYRIALCERAFHLARPGGRIALVVPASLFRREYGRALVSEVLERFIVRDIIYLEEDVRSDLLCLSCEKSPGGLTKARIHRVESEDTAPEMLEGRVFEASREVGRLGDAIDEVLMDRETRRLVRAIHESEFESLESLLVAPAGRTTSPGIVSLWLADGRIARRLTAHLVNAENIQPFRVENPSEIYWPYEKPGRPWSPLPEQLEERLWPYKVPLRERTTFGKKAHEVGHWYEHLEHYPFRLKGPRVVVNAYGRDSSAAMIPDGYAVSSSGIVLSFADYEEAYVALAILNSSFGSFWLRTQGFITESGAVELNIGAVHGVPIPGRGRGELARLARKLERLSRGSDQPPKRHVDLADVVHGLEKERQVQAELTGTIEAIYHELDCCTYRAFGLLEDEDSEFDDSFFENHPEVEHLEAARAARRKREPTTLEEAEKLFALRIVERAASESRLVDLAAVAEDYEVDASWLVQRLIPHAVEWNPLRVLNAHGLDVLARCERVRIQQRRADEAGEDGPAEWPLLESDHFAGKALPSMTTSQTDAHHWRQLSAYYRDTSRLFYLGDLSELVESPVFALMTHDPAEHLAIARTAVRYAEQMAFYPPGPATLEDPRMLGLIGRLLYEEQAIRRGANADGLERIFRSQLAEGAGLDELVASYRTWLEDGSLSLGSTAGDAQLDLAKLVELEAFFAQERETTLREAALRFVSDGWTFVQTRSVLEALAASGRIEAISENHWRIREG